MPKPKFSSRRVCFRSTPTFRLCRPVVIARDRLFTPQFRSCRCWFCVAGVSLKGSRLRVVVELILANIRIDGQQHVRIEGVLIAGSDAPGEHALALILRQLVVVVGNLNPVSRGEQVEVKDVFAVGLIVEAIENGLVVAHVVERRELRRIQKAAAANAVDRQEVSELRVAIAEPDAAHRRCRTSHSRRRDCRRPCPRRGRSAW